MQSLEEHINKDYLTPETRNALQEQTNSIIFEKATGIRAEQYMREQIVALHKYAKGTLKYRDFQQAQIFLEMIDCSGHLKIRKIMFFEYFMYGFYFVGGIFLNFLAVVCFFLVLFTPLTVELQGLFILLTLFFTYFGFFVLSQTWPISAAKKIKKVIKNYQKDLSNQSIVINNQYCLPPHSENSKDRK
ncbi:MAG: hypothetical protein QNJ34_00135 [Xenococcaceae cyanobacterium MO_188.B29]|nr:hypothetical protein [Xenococcaceae cyanobacterium MO_188.B29]